MITYKQWKTLNEDVVGTFGSVLSQPPVVGGVVGATGASSNWSLEETKSKIRKYMFGEEEEGEPKPKPKKKPEDGGSKGKNPFGGGGGGGGFGKDESPDQDDDMGGDDDGFGDDDQDSDQGDDMGGHDDGGFGGDDQDQGETCPTCGKPMDDDGGLGDDQDDDDGFGDDGGFGGDDQDQGDDMGMGDDSMGDDGGLGDDMGGHDDMGMGGMGDDQMGGMNDLGGSKGNVCDKCGHHEADKNAKFCKMCGKGMSKFMRKYMNADSDVSIKGKKATPWLDKGNDNGEVKKNGRQTGKDMFPTVKGGKKDPGRDPNASGGKVLAVRAKNEHICGICGSLACEVHDGSTPNANRLNKSFFKSLTSQVGSRGGKFDDGVHDNVVEDAFYTPDKNEPQAPFPGEVGYAPAGKLGGFLG